MTKVDTSGVASCWRENKLGVSVGPTYWSDLTPFQQGFVEAALRSLSRPMPWMQNRRVAAQEPVDMDAPHGVLAGRWIVCDDWSDGRASAYGCEGCVYELRADRGAWVIMNGRGQFLRTTGWQASGDDRRIRRFSTPVAAAVAAEAEEDDGTGRRVRRNPGFSDLAPETLARFMEDCARFVKLSAGIERMCRLSMAEQRPAGRDFWRERNGEAGFRRGDWDGDCAADLVRIALAFPPLRLYVADDGLVRIAE